MEEMILEITNESRSMDDIGIGDIYKVPKPWSIRMNDGNMLVMVVKKYKHFAQCRPILFPSTYGMSKPYFIDFTPTELKESNRMKSYEEVREWVVNKPTFIRCDGLHEELVKVKEAFERRIAHV